MEIDVRVITSETDPGYYKGEVILTRVDDRSRLQKFDFALSDVGTLDQQLIVRRHDWIFLDVGGLFQDDNEALHQLSETQLQLLVIMGDGVTQTIQQIKTEREASGGAVEAAAQLWKELLGEIASFEIQAEHHYTIDISESTDQSHINQLFEL